MTVENNKIVKCTDKELFFYWLDNMSELFSYEEYKGMCIRNGTEVTDDE